MSDDVHLIRQTLDKFLQDCLSTTDVIYILIVTHFEVYFSKADKNMGNCASSVEYVVVYLKLKLPLNASLSSIYSSRLQLLLLALEKRELFLIATPRNFNKCNCTWGKHNKETTHIPLKQLLI